MTTTETQQLNDLWKRVQEYRDERAFARLDGDYWRAAFCDEMADSLLARIRRICMAALATIN